MAIGGVCGRAGGDRDSRVGANEIRTLLCGAGGARSLFAPVISTPLQNPLRCGNGDGKMEGVVAGDVSIAITANFTAEPLAESLEYWLDQARPNEAGLNVVWFVRRIGRGMRN